jgi:hypothetical protein
MRAHYGLLSSGAPLNLWILNSLLDNGFEVVHNLRWGLAKPSARY